MALAKKYHRLVRYTAILTIIFLSFLFVPSIEAAPQPQAYDCAAQTSISQIECAALVALYTATSGTSWSNDTDWLFSADPCSWYGITCNAAGPPANVIEISLITNNLNGPLPVELADLSSLTVLSLSGNQLTGSIPVEIGSITTLVTLDLSNNLLGGAIPVAIGNLSALQTLNLYNNQLTGALPGEIGDIGSLVTLNVSSNAGLTGHLPNNLTSLSALTTFDISGTDLCERQEAFFQTWLSGLTYTPSGILCVDCAVQTGITQTECEALLALYNNTDGDSWTDNTNWVEDNDPCTWNGVTCNAAGPPANVIDIDLNSNNLDGTLPNQIGSFPFLTSMDLSGNSLTGSLPGQLSGLVLVQTINFADNGFSGVLPNALGNLTFLQTLDLSNNTFDGQVPVSYANLTSLTYIDTTGSTLCLPNDANLLAWYAGITTKVDTIAACVVPDTATPTITPTNTGVPITLTPTAIPSPTLTPTATNTPTITPTPTMLGQFQTLTALALEDTLTATAGYRSNTPTASSTSYYILVSQTLVPVSELTETTTPTPDQNQAAAVDAGSGGISGWWFILIFLAVGMIGTGVFLVLRQKRSENESSSGDDDGGSSFETFK